jgi:hypothetical protein
LKGLPGIANGPIVAPTPAPTLPPIAKPTIAPVIPGSVSATWPAGVPLPPRSVAVQADLLKTYTIAPVLPAPRLGPTDTMPILSTGAGMYFITPPPLVVTPWVFAANAGSPNLGWLAVYLKAPGDTMFRLHDAVPLTGQRVHAVPIKALQPTAPGTYWFFTVGGDSAGGIQDPAFMPIQGAVYSPGLQQGSASH